MSALDFNPLDQEFLPKELVQKETLNLLAHLELEKHKLRMNMVLAGNEDAPTGPNSQVTFKQALANIEKSMIVLKSKFADVLFPADAPTQ